jgi:ankyrin repeat protein
MNHLPISSDAGAYEEQAAHLLAAHAGGGPEAIRLFHERHPRFLDEKIPWLPKPIPDSEIQAAALDIGDARLALARWYDFLDWSALTEFVAAVSGAASAVFRFESAVDAVVNGDEGALNALIAADPQIVHARSTRRTHFDPPVHRATLLHYVAANGVEGYRQKTPRNAVAIAMALLRAGADPNSLASLYGRECSTMMLLVSSCHPAKAGLQVALVHTLADFGASVDAVPTALAFGYADAATALVARGAKVDDLAAAAGLGLLDDAKRLLDGADAGSRHRAFVLAAQLGHAAVVEMLLDAGEDPDRYNPAGNHAHSTPLHQAALAGHESVVRLLVERGARTDIEDTIYHGTPLGWAEHGGKTAVAAYLRGR